MKLVAFILAITLLCTSMAGCSVGYNRLIFVTKSNVGLDVDSQPPTAQLAIARTEGAFAPVFEGGNTIPLLASFRFKSSGAFASNIGSVFAAGDSAVAMARLYDSNSIPAGDLTVDEWKKLVAKFDSTVPLTVAPTFPDFVKPQKKGAVRPVMFGTDTSLGLKLGWSGLTAHVPDTMRFGYTRKELAWAPIEILFTPDAEGSSTGAGTAVSPSLLATIDTGSDPKGVGDLGLTHLQYFATGSAATALTLRQEVRQALIQRIDPNRDTLINLQSNKSPEAKPLQGRVRAWLGGQDSENRKQLRQWLKDELNNQNSEAMWLRSAPTNELEAAIDHFAIP
jgi:hypothetical protein